MNTYLMKMQKSSFLWLVLIFLLGGCAQDSGEPTATATQEVVVQATEIATETAVSETPEPTSTVEVQPTITPEPTPVTPSITVGTQTLTEEGTLVVESVTSDGPGWIVIYADDNDLPGPQLGFAPVADGQSLSINVTIDPWAATPTLHARLHVDGGGSGEFEFPGSDSPVKVGAGEVVESFTYESELPVPYIEVTDQDVKLDGVVQIDEVFALAPSWLVIQTFEDGIIGRVIGQASIDEGQSSNLQVPIRWRDATANLIAVLHEDRERPGGFNAANDLPLLVANEPVTTQFAVQLPPDIFIYDQPVMGGRLVLERVISPKAGWLVVYSSDNGQPDRIIGSEKVSQGINYLVETEVVAPAATSQLLLQLHEETNNPAEFNFPLSDPVATFDGQPIPPTTVNTNPGNYLITQDQTLGEENEVVIPLVVTDLDSWAVIYSQDADGRPDEILGQGWLPAGINRDIRIAIPAGMAGEPLLAVLHQDADNPREFDFPDGDDVPLQRNRQIILSPFSLREFSAADSVNPR